MKTFSTTIYCTLVSLFLFSSCCLGDKIAQYEYRITNNSDKQITVSINEGQSDNPEIIFIINVGETMTVLFSTGGIVSACESIVYTDEKIDTDLEDFTVVNQDSVISSRDYLDGDEWDFDEGIYTITVEQDEF